MVFFCRGLMILSGSGTSPATIPGYSGLSLPRGKIERLHKTQNLDFFRALFEKK